MAPAKERLKLTKAAKRKAAQVLKEKGTAEEKERNKNKVCHL